jgi:hypothetical protein
VIAQAVNPVRNPGGEFISNGANLMNFLKGPEQFTPLLHTLIAVSGKGFIAVTGFIIPIYQRTYSWTLKECGQLPISLLLAAFGRALFSMQIKASK